MRSRNTKRAICEKGRDTGTPGGGSNQLQIAEEARLIAEKDSEERKHEMEVSIEKVVKACRKLSLQLRVLAERNKWHTTKKAGQRAAGLVRETIRRESGS